jgi:hypothetical protein
MKRAGLGVKPALRKSRLTSRPPGTHFENGRLFLVVTFEIKGSAGQAIWGVKSRFIRGFWKIKTLCKFLLLCLKPDPATGG